MEVYLTNFTEVNAWSHSVLSNIIQHEHPVHFWISYPINFEDCKQSELHRGKCWIWGPPNFSTYSWSCISARQCQCTCCSEWTNLPPARNVWLLPWPTCCLDMSRIYHAWDYDRQQRTRTAHRVQSMNEFQQQLEAIWNGIPQHSIPNRYDFIPRPVQNLIAPCARSNDSTSFLLVVYFYCPAILIIYFYHCK